MRALAMTGMDTASWISTILSGSAMRATPLLTRIVPISAIAGDSSCGDSALEAAVDLGLLGVWRRDRPEEDGVLLRPHHVGDVSPHAFRYEAPKAVLHPDGVLGARGEGDPDGIPGLERKESAVVGVLLDHAELVRIGGDAVTEAAQACRGRLGLVGRGF